MGPILQSRYYDSEVCRFINRDDVSILQIAQGSVTGGNLYAYCENNPVNMSDESGELPAIIAGAVFRANYLQHYFYNRSLKIWGYIYNQNRGTAAKFIYGFFRSSRNGCGWIATYNALIMLKNSMKPCDIIAYYERVGAVLYGALGTKPSAIVSFFKKKGYRVTVTENTSKFGENAQKNKVSIVMYLHKKGIHYFIIRYKYGRFWGYNVFTNNDGVTDLAINIPGFLKNHGVLPLLMISIS